MFLPHHLGQLANFGLIETALAPADTYRFRHALLQEAAYASLLRVDRVAVHRAVGEVLETALGESRADQAMILGHHFERGGDEARALHYYTQAGDQAFQRYAIAEALVAYDQALTLADRLPPPPPTWLHLYSQRGRALELNTQYAAALTNYQHMENRAQQTHDTPMLLGALLAQATLYSTVTPVYDEKLSLQLTARTLDLARTLGDPRAETRALWIRMLAVGYQGAAAEAVTLGEQAIALARAHQFRSELAFALHDIAWVYVELQRWADAQAAVQEANDLWRALGNLPMLADNLLSQALYGNDVAQQWVAAREGLAISQTIGNVMGQSRGHNTFARLYFSQGEVRLALAHIQTALTLAQEHRLTPYIVMNHQACLGFLYQLGAFAAATAEHARFAAALLNDPASSYLQSVVQVWQVRLWLATGEHAAAAPVWQSLVAQAPANLNPQELETALWTWTHYEWWVANAQWEAAARWAAQMVAAATADTMVRGRWQLAQAQALWQLGQPAAARPLLEAAGQLLVAPAYNYWRWQVLALLAVVETALDRPTAAATVRAEAQPIYETIAAQLPADLQRAFRALPAAQWLA